MIDRVMTEVSLDRQFASPAEYLERFKTRARAAVAAGAEAVIPAEGVVAGIVGINGLREVDGVPVVDSVGVPLLAAEHRLTLARRLGLQVSRKHPYPRPSAAAVEAIFGVATPSGAG